MMDNGTPRLCSLGIHRGIVVLLALFVCLATTYSLVTPLFEAPDELFHYAFVKHLADGQGLPVQDRANPGLWQQEGSQPPLYYALAALASCWVPSDDLPQILQRNPHASIGSAQPDGNGNITIHTPREAFPYHGASLAVHLARLLSVVLGTLTVLFTYLIGLEVVPRRPGLALGAAAVVAFTPMFVFISGTVNNDNLVVALATVALWLLLRLPPTPARWAALGAIIGLAALAKVSGLALLAPTGLTLAYLTWRQRDWRFFLRGSTCMVTAAALVAGWWYFRNWRLYHDPLGWSAFLDIIGRRSPRPTLHQLLAEWPGFLKSYWGVFGWFNVLAPAWYYRLCDGLVLLGAGGLFIQMARRVWRRKWPTPDALFRLGLVTSWPLIVTIGLIRWTMLTPASQGRLLFPAIAPLSFLLALGWASYLPDTLQAVLHSAGDPRSTQHATRLTHLALRFTFYASHAIPIALLAALAIWLPFGVIAPAYARPPLLTPAQLAAIPNRLDLAVGDEMELLGYQVEKRAVQPGEELSVTLYWRATAPMARNYSVFVHLLDENGIKIAQRDMYPGRGLFPTSLWQAGDAIADRYVIQVPANTFRPNQLQLIAGLYSLSDGRPLAVRDAQGRDPGKSVPLAEVTVPAAPEGSIPNPTSFNLARQATLAGYDLDRTALHPGETLHLTLFWQPRTSLAGAYAAFAHVLGSDGSLWAGAAAPAGNWPQGQVTPATYDLTLRPDTPPGEYYVDAGLYHTNTGQPLSLLDRWGHALDQRATLTRIRVLPAEPAEPAPQSDLPPVQHPLDVTFGGVARLRGYSLDDKAPNPHEPLRITLYWEALGDAPVPADYTVFVHLLDAQARVVAQHDSPPDYGRLPTTSWAVGEVVIDEHSISFADTSYVGRVLVEVGLYDPKTLQRLATGSGDDKVILPEQLLVRP